LSVNSDAILLFASGLSLLFNKNDKIRCILSREKCLYVIHDNL